MKKSIYLILAFLLSFQLSSAQQQNSLYTFDSLSDTRWVSFENPTGSTGNGGKENLGAKGHPSDFIKAGETKTLLDFEGPGIINRMWITVIDRSPEMLRSLVIKIYWDQNEKPAVSVPFGDFFGVGLGKTAVIDNALFTNPEGRSFTSVIQMPFKKWAKIEIVNEGKTDLNMIFFDVNLQKISQWNDDFLYFHAFWHRDTATQLEVDFEILPKVNGKGRYLGANISVNANPIYTDTWWGEGEVKVFLNGDGEFASLVGTGTEDYIGTGWGQGAYVNQFAGCPIADDEKEQWSFYRFHIPDPVFFKTDCRVTIQQIGGSPKENVIKLQEAGVKLNPITIFEGQTLHHIYQKGNPISLNKAKLPDGWTNFYRSDDVGAVAYFYLDQPVSNLPKIQSVDDRIWDLRGE